MKTRSAASGSRRTDSRATGDPSDEELVARVGAGDAAAFGELVHRHERRIYNLAYRMLGRPEDAQDATQDAFLSCYRNLSRFRGDSAFATWLHRIAVNACYDMLRKRTPEPVDVVDAPAPPVSDHADRAAAAVDVQRALMLVAPEFRSVLVLHDVQGIPYEEIATALEVPLGTVKSRLHRGRLALAEAIGETGRGRRSARPTRKTAQAREPRSQPASSKPSVVASRTREGK